MHLTFRVYRLFLCVCVRMVVRSLLESPLNFHNYADRFQVLLYLEECQMEVDIKRYDKHNVTMKRDSRNKKLLVLEVNVEQGSSYIVPSANEIFFIRPELLSYVVLEQIHIRYEAMQHE